MRRTLMLATSVAVVTLFASASMQAQTAKQPADQSTQTSKDTTKATTGMARASAADQRFVAAAMQADMAEVEIGKLAQQNGGSADAKSFGQMLEQDHGQHLQKAKDLAQQLGINPPTGPSSPQKAIYDKLAKLNGASFDKQFAAAMVKDHKEDVAKFEKEAKSKGPVAGFAQETVPVLQKHLQTAQALTSAKPSSR